MDAHTTLTLRCTACGALAQASCKCDAPYEPLSRSERLERRREKVSELYKDGHGLTMEQIADKLKVSRSVISDDLNLSETDKLKRPMTATNPKGAGRPKGRRAPAPRPFADKVNTLADAGKSVKEIAQELSISQHTLRRVLEWESVRREAIANAEPEIDRKLLSMSAQQKLDAAIRAHKKLLDREYDQRRIKEIGEHIQRIAPTLQKDKNEAFQREQTYREFMRKQTKIMTTAEFTLVCSLLHPDSRASATDERLRRAFQMFKPKKFALTGER